METQNITRLLNLLIYFTEQYLWTFKIFEFPSFQ